MQLALLDEEPAGECRYPHVLPSTAYRYGCRCPGCTTAKTHAPGQFGQCEVDGCSASRGARRRRCPMHDALCRHDGCTNPRRRERAAKYCTEHSTMVEGVLAADRPSEQACALCDATFTGKRTPLPLCASCRANGQAIRQWAKHGVTIDTIRAWLADPRCWICQQTIRLATWGRSEDARPVVDHDHRHCPGEVGCTTCVRGLAHNRCNLRVGQLDKLLALVGPERLHDILDRITDAPQ